MLFKKIVYGSIIPSALQLILICVNDGRAFLNNIFIFGLSEVRKSATKSSLEPEVGFIKISKDFVTFLK